jgi:hypothetical protein
MKSAPRVKTPQRARRVEIGVIAEDKSDVEVIKRLLEKTTKKPFVVRRFVGNGCGKILAKCNAWADNLYVQGCRRLIVVHDLDRNNLKALKASLEEALNGCSIPVRAIIIPIEEIEAWLLADSNAISNAMKLKIILKKIPNPESIKSPKEYLSKLVRLKSGHSRSYVNTIHNEQIAMHCSLRELKRCDSFRIFADFVGNNI